jgi:phospholipid/cholesterol/gamma-HCH transport system substrate-binding protein
MADRPHWQDLRLGIVAAIIVAVGAVLILVFGRVGIIHGKKITLFITTDGARGVIRGTEVWLDGQKVGQVKGITFRPPTVPPSERLVLEIHVLETARSHLRRDTRVEVRSGGSIIGDQVVSLRSGTVKSPAVSDGDTIHAGEQMDLESVGADAVAASRELPAIMSNVKILAAQLQTAEGTLGAFGMDQGGAQMAGVRAKTARLMAHLSDSRGTVGLAFDGSAALRTRAERAMAEVDSLRALIGSSQHSLGRFRRDSSLVREISRLRAELQEIQQLAASPTGTIGRLRGDSAVVRNIHRDLASLDSLFADIKKHPLRYIAF